MEHARLYRASLHPLQESPSHGKLICEQDRLTDLEKKVDLILNSKQRRSDHLDEDLARESPPGSFNTSTQMQTGTDIEAPSAHHSSRGPSCSGYRSLSPRTEFRLPKLNISQSDIVRGLDTYFERFHRQPIWCFNRQEVGHNTEVSRELIYSFLELTARFTRSNPRDHDAHSYGESARWSIMLRVASDTVELETIESLCLLSYSAFIGNRPLPFPSSKLTLRKMATCNLDNFTSASAFNSIVLEG